MRKPTHHDGNSLLPYMEKRRSITAPRHLTTTSSRKARVSVEPKADSQAGIIYAYIISRGDAGACDFEGIRDLKPLIPNIENSYRDRRGRLYKKQLIKLGDITRKSPSGFDCDSWVAVRGTDVENHNRPEPTNGEVRQPT